MLGAKRAVDRMQVRAISGMVQGSARVDAPVLKGAKSVGSAIETRYLLRKADVDASDLSDGHQRRLGAFLRRTDAEGAAAIRQMDPETREDFLDLRRPCRASGAWGASVSTTLDGCVDDETIQEQLGAAARAGDEFDSLAPATRLVSKDELKLEGRYLRVLAEADSGNGLRFYAAFEGDAKGLNRYLRLANEDSISEAKLARFANDAGADGTQLVKALDDGSGTLRRFFDLQIENADIRSWREDMAKIYANHDNVEPQQVASYVNDLSTITRLRGENDVNINNIRGLIEEVDSNDYTSIIGQQLEANRVAYWAKKASNSDLTIESISVEPSKRIDIELDDGASSRFIETKNAKNALSKDRVRRAIISTNDKFENRGIDIGEGDTRVLTIGAKRKGFADDFANPREDIKEILANFYPDGVSIDKIRIVKSNGEILEYEVTELYDEINA